MANTLDLFREGKFLSPFREFRDIESSFDRMMSEMMNWRRRHSDEDLQFTPSCEASETDKKYILKFDLPGVSRDDVKVDIVNDILTVSAERKEEKKGDDKKRHFSEISYGSYYRSFTLPSPVEADKVNAGFEDGVLTVTVPKSGEARTKHIEIH